MSEEEMEVMILLSLADDKTQIIIGIGHHLGRCAKQAAQGTEVGQAEERGEGAEKEGGDEADSGHNRGRGAVLGAEGAGDEVAAAMAEKEAQRLDKSHEIAG